MAVGLPYAIAAQVGHPDRQCIAFVGDGGFSMLMADFVTCVKYKLPVKVVIIKNNSLGQIKWEQMVFLGNPEYGCELEPMTTSYFLSRDNVVPTIGGGMASWREKLFAQMHHNASAAADFLNLPNNSVVELGSKVEI